MNFFSKGRNDVVKSKKMFLRAGAGEKKTGAGQKRTGSATLLFSIEASILASLPPPVKELLGGRVQI